MKTLIDKIIENLEKACNDWINQEGNKAINLIFKDGIEYAIRTIKSTTEEAEFEEIARVMMKHLGEKYHTHHTVIITNSTAELLEGKRSAGYVEDYIPD